MSAPAPFTRLEWDTNFFGFGVARLSGSDIGAAQVAESLARLRAEGYRLVYWTVPADNLRAASIAQANAGVLCDERVTYIGEHSTHATILASGPPRSTSCDPDTPAAALIELALQSSVHSRFRMDPRFPSGLCDRLYACWVTRALSRDIAWDVRAVHVDGDLAGFVTLATKDDCGNIGLIAVDGQWRGLGIGKTLVMDAGEAFAARGHRWATVATQARNVAACRLYESCGYRTASVERVYHFWI